MFAPENIAKAVTWFMTFPFYIYALIKWHQFSDHFLIKKRFPALSRVLFWIMFIAQSLSVLEGIGHDLGFHSHSVHHHMTTIILSLTFTISALILYRINLIYLQWKTSQSMSVSSIRVPCSSAITLNNTVNNTVNNAPVLASKRKAASIYYSPLSQITLCFVLIGSLVVYILCIFTQYVYVAGIVSNSILSAFIAASIWNIRHKNVVEGIGCIKECVLILVALIVQMVFQIAFAGEQRHLLVEMSTFYSLHYQAVMILYMPLYLLWQSEGSLNFGAYHKELNQHIFSADIKARKPSKKVTIDTVLELNSTDIDTTPKRGSNTSKTLDLVSQTSNSDNSCTSGVVFNDSLFDFLYHNERNHTLFSDYLRICFAIENLLFVERVSVFHQIVLRMKEKHEAAQAAAVQKLPALSNACSLPVATLSIDASDCISSEVSSISGTDGKRSAGLVEPEPAAVSVEIVDGTSKEKEEIHRLEFRYLSDIYCTYQQVIDEAVVCEDSDHERYHINNYKKQLLDICQELYDQFLSVFAATQVNLSYGVQDALDYSLDRGRGACMSKFETYDDFLMLFDNALIETYRLMISAYLFGFRKYVKKQFPDAQRAF